jgi:hypothetical protein
VLAPAQRAGPLGRPGRPGVTGPERAPELIRAGLRRLGNGETWKALVRHAPRGFDLDVPVLFALDITDGPPGRTEVYFRHYRTSPQGLLRQLAPGFGDGRAAALCRVLTASVPRAAAQLPVTCLSFHGAQAGPPDTTLYMPLWSGLPDDEVVRLRIRELLITQGTGADRYDRALTQVGTRPLRGARGIHNYLSWQPGDPPRMKVYWSPELRGAAPRPRYLRERPP